MAAVLPLGGGAPLKWYDAGFDAGQGAPSSWVEARLVDGDHDDGGGVAAAVEARLVAGGRDDGGGFAAAAAGGAGGAALRSALSAAVDVALGATVRPTPPDGIAVVEYGLCAGNDCPERDPVTWTLLGLPADADADTPPSEWVTLHTVDAAGELFAARYAWAWFPLPAPAAALRLRAVRLVVTAVRGPTTGAVQLCRWHLRTAA